MQKPTTAILRFRDLVTAPDHTIANHMKICDTFGWVWWGWWNKPGETIPADTFIALNGTAQNEGLSLILFDSGRLKTYRCQCDEIEWDKSFKGITAPELKRTPEYYNKSAFPAWFKLSSFEEIPSDALKKYTYVRVNKFFEDNVSRFDAFYNKQVYSPEELRQQDRTIWFVRPYREGDPTNEVTLLDGARLSPSDFPTDHIHSQSLNLLWVSDLHFGDHHQFPRESDNTQEKLGGRIVDTLKKEELDFGGILVSGDITWKAKESEYEDARSFLQQLSAGAKNLANYAILTCPGNHDLAFSETPEDKTARVHTEPVPKASRKAYASFYESLFYKQPNEYLSCGRRFLLKNCIPVEIVALNSSLLDQKKDWFQGHGFIGEKQIEHAAEAMGWSGADTPRAFRIVMLHHHMMPVSYTEQPAGGYAYSVVLDAERVIQWAVKHRVDLILHGHMHRSFVAKVTRPEDGNPENPWHSFFIAGLASTGVAENHRKDENAFAILKFHQDKVVIEWFSVDPVESSKPIWKLEIPKTN